MSGPDNAPTDPEASDGDSDVTLEFGSVSAPPDISSSGEEAGQAPRAVALMSSCPGAAGKLVEATTPAACTKAAAVTPTCCSFPTRTIRTKTTWPQELNADVKRYRVDRAGIGAGGSVDSSSSAVPSGTGPGRAGRSVSADSIGIISGVRAGRRSSSSSSSREGSRGRKGNHGGGAGSSSCNGYRALCMCEGNEGTGCGDSGCGEGGCRTGSGCGAGGCTAGGGYGVGGGCKAGRGRGSRAGRALQEPAAADALAGVGSGAGGGHAPAKLAGPCSYTASLWEAIKAHARQDFQEGDMDFWQGKLTEAEDLRHLALRMVAKAKSHYLREQALAGKIKHLVHNGARGHGNEKASLEPTDVSREATGSEVCQAAEEQEQATARKRSGYWKTYGRQPRPAGFWAAQSAKKRSQIEDQNSKQGSKLRDQGKGAPTGQEDALAKTAAREEQFRAADLLPTSPRASELRVRVLIGLASLDRQRLANCKAEPKSLEFEEAPSL